MAPDPTTLAADVARFAARFEANAAVHAAAGHHCRAHSDALWAADARAAEAGWRELAAETTPAQ